MVQNPFNGIERNSHSHEHPLLKSAPNPFNGIESHVEGVGGAWGLGEGIHSMELKDKKGGGGRFKLWGEESIQWN